MTEEQKIIAARQLGRLSAHCVDAFWEQLNRDLRHPDAVRAIAAGFAQGLAATIRETTKP